MLRDWKTQTLDDLATVERGRFSARPRNDPRYYGGSTPFIQTGDVSSANGLLRTWSQTLNADGVAVSKVFPAGTIFVTIAANIGETAISTFDAACPDSVVAVRSRPGVNRDWLYQALRFKKTLLDSFATQNAQKNINLEVLRPLCFDTPPFPEQRRIAEILCTWDQGIEQLEALRAEKERRYNALARMFFDPCHPTFHERLNAWQEFELGDVFRERNQSGEEGDRLLSITMNGGVIDREDVGRKDTSTEDKSNYKLILPGDIGYNTMRMWQGVSGLSALRGIISPAYTVVTPLAGRVLDRYAAHLFKSRRMVFDFERYSQGLTSDTWNLKFPAFSKIRVFLPPAEDQEKQANLLDALIAESTVIGKQLETFSRQKRGLMQKLLTGEWRVSLSTGNVEKSAECTAEELTP